MSRFSIPDRQMIQYSSRELLRDVWQMLRGSRARFAVATFFRLTSDLVWLYPAFALASVVTFLTDYRAGTSLFPLWQILGFWVVASCWRYLGNYVSKSLGFRVAERVGIEAKLKIVQHLFRLDLAWHERENAGNKLKRIDRGGQGLTRVLRIWIVNLIEIGVNFIGMVIVLSRFDYLIAGITLFFLVTFAFLASALMRPAARAEYAVDLKEEDIHGLLFEAINNIRTVKVLALGRGLTRTLQAAFGVLFEKIRVRIFRFQTRALVLNIWGQLFRLGLVVVIALGAMAGRYEVGFLILFVGYFNSLWASVNELSEVSQDLVVAKYGVARMMLILREPVRIDDERGKKPLPKGWRLLQMRDVSFGYQAAPVLKHVSLEIRRGEKIGIVGLSGSGKSTLFKLLLKEHENYSGVITVDGTSLREIRKSDYFTQVAVVLQDAEVFNFPLRENVTIASPTHRRDEVRLRRSLSIAHVTDFARRLPNGIDTLIGEKGVKLSGGEKQRVGIARAIFKEPELLFLDEATSHLDLESEQKIQDSLHRFFRSVTAVVIAHRLTTIREMDRIYVLQAGRVVEVGSFAQLMENHGRFFELWEQQKL